MPTGCNSPKRLRFHVACIATRDQSCETFPVQTLVPTDSKPLAQGRFSQPFTDFLSSLESIRHAYYKLALICGESGSGKSQFLREISGRLELPRINLSLLLSQRLINQTRRQISLVAEASAIDVIDTHLASGLCLDNTELLFDSSLRLNPILFLQEASRNRLLVATWNGRFSNGELQFGSPDHPDHFCQRVAGFPVVTMDSGIFTVSLPT